MWAKGTAAAIGRSLDTYFRDAERTLRMEALLAAFVPRGGLAFDIGAHLGDRTASLARLGARVVALEPQPAPFRALRALHGRRAGVTLLRAAAGRAAGRAPMFLNSANPAVSTLSPGLVAAARDGAAWQGQSWDGEVAVPVTTLDALIRDHGLPDFVKIDVEGFEAEVLGGLTHPLPALSFEVTTLSRAVGLACLDRLATLGDYAFNLSLGETHLLRREGWVPADVLRGEIARLTDRDNSCDVYATLQQRGSAEWPRRRAIH